MSATPPGSKRSLQSQPVPREPNCLVRKLKCIIFISILLIAGAIGLSLVLTGKPNPLDYFVPTDPPGSTEAVRWDANQGLELEVINALEDFWTPFFDRSVQEWNQSEALTIRTGRTSYDFDCNPIRGKMKVCNGDYGNTDWRGLNTIVLVHDHVEHSVAQLNDYHLPDDIQRRYTMCHEIGHGWGLPHTDTDYFNRDRGDCLDYTNSPRNNLLPGQYNLDLLVELYGTPTMPRTNPSLNNTNSGEGGLRPGGPRPPPQRPPQKEDKEDEEEDEEDRYLQTVLDPAVASAVYGGVDPNDRDTIRSYADACHREHCHFKVNNDIVIEVYKLMV